MGQSKSSRRRRRKRKGKGAEAVGAPGSQASQSSHDQPQSPGQSIPSMQAGAAQPQNFSNSGQQQNSSGSGKRWKKKFRDRDRQRSPENPGNVASPAGSGSNNGGGYRDRDTHQFGNNAGGGFKRKVRWRQAAGSAAPRSFVGPMDHSYRAVNGNFADTPPSTIETHGNGNYGRSNGGGCWLATAERLPNPSTILQQTAVPFPFLRTHRQRSSSSSKTFSSSLRSRRLPVSLASRSLLSRTRKRRSLSWLAEKRMIFQVLSSLTSIMPMPNR